MNKPTSKARMMIRIIQHGKGEVDLAFVGYVVEQLLKDTSLDILKVKSSLFRRLILIAEKINK